MKSRSRMTQKSSVVIFRALKTSAASLTSAASATSLASTASTALFPQKIPDPEGLISNDMKMTNTGPFLWNESSKIQIFPNIYFLFCQRLLSVEARICYFFENWLMKLKFPNLRNILIQALLL